MNTVSPSSVSDLDPSDNRPVALKIAALMLHAHGGDLVRELWRLFPHARRSDVFLACGMVTSLHEADALLLQQFEDAK